MDSDGLEDRESIYRDGVAIQSAFSVRHGKGRTLSAALLVGVLRLLPLAVYGDW